MVTSTTTSTTIVRCSNGSNNIHEGDGLAVKLLSDLNGGRVGLDDVDGQLQNLRQSSQLKRNHGHGQVVKANGVRSAHINSPEALTSSCPPQAAVCSTSLQYFSNSSGCQQRSENENLYENKTLFYICTCYLSCTCRQCRGLSGRAGSRRRGFSYARPFVTGALSRSSMIPAVKPGTVHSSNT